MQTLWLIRAGEHGKFANTWLKGNPVGTVGWDVGNLAESDPGWENTKAEVESRYDPNDPGQVTGRIRSFVGVREDPGKNVKEGDRLVILGDATVEAVATAGEYRYEPEGLAKASSHTYWRNLKEVTTGPVKLRDLPARFRQGGRDSLQLGSTLQRYRKGDTKSVEDLESILSSGH